MRGKRYKAAVQPFYKQQGWVKQDHQHWRDLGPAIGLHEEDSESEWEKVLARDRPRRWKQPVRPAAPTDWGDLLNRHLLPREGAQQAAQPAAADPGGQPQQQQHDEPSATSKQPRRQQTAAGGDGEPSDRRRATPPATTAAAADADDTMEGNFNHLILSQGRGPRPSTAPPELPIGRGVTLHMRSGPFGIWAAITTHSHATYAADYGPQPARSYTRARQTLRDSEPVPDAYIGVNTAFALFPWGDIQHGAPEKFLMWVTATGGQRDPDGAEMHPGDAYLLEWDRGEQRWRPGNLPRKVAQQYYYDWGRHRGTPAITRPPPNGATYPLGQWEQMALNLIPRPYTMGGQTNSNSGAPSTPQPQPSPAMAPAPAQQRRQNTEADQPSLMQQHIAQTQIDDTLGQPSGASDAAGSHGPAPVGAPPEEVARMLRCMRELALWAAEQHLPMPLRYELESAMAVLGDCLQHARLQRGADQPRGVKRKQPNLVSEAKLRLLEICEEGDNDEPNQHQIYEDLNVIKKMLKEGEQQFYLLTQRQGGVLLRQGGEGLQQAQQAVERAQAATVQGGLDWCTTGWGAAVAVLLDEAQEAIAENDELQYVHQADAVGLSQGGQECPSRPPEPDRCLEAILGDVRAALGFLSAGPHGQVLNVLAAMAMWQSQQTAYMVETQTTDGGEEPPTVPPTGAPPHQDKWTPQPGAAQWSGSVPSPGDETAAERSTEEGGPTDEDLLQAMEEFERQQAAEDLAAAAEQGEESLFTRRRTEAVGGESHRRRRLHAGEP